MINKGGTQYGFCPAKAGWDSDTRDTFNLLVVAAETGSMLYNGGIADQPSWFIELLTWFAPKYDDIKFFTRMEGLFGSSKKKSGMPGPNSIKQKRQTRRGK